ncbi:MAG: hypothetical protein HYZ63_02625 [Candidatus Andersenbacteria bacterium]|nr:hypothetical protein [Candidatus Andersenbacteria bacterium]
MDIHTGFGRVHFRVVTIVAAVVAVSFSFSSAVWAAPQRVTQFGTTVRSAAPDKPFDMKFRVTNTGGTTYNGVKVVFHVPAGDMGILATSPANAIVDEDAATWSNVPIPPGKSFSPSFTLKMDAGTPLKTKMRIWVEVTGEDMEATSTNFSVTAVAAKKATTLTSSDITSMFQAVYGRAPSTTELTYWMGRRGDKPTRTSLQGAMGFHQAQGIPH